MEEDRCRSGVQAEEEEDVHATSGSMVELDFVRSMWIPFRRAMSRFRKVIVQPVSGVYMMQVALAVISMERTAD